MLLYGQFVGGFFFMFFGLTWLVLLPMVARNYICTNYPKNKPIGEYFL